MEKNARNDAKAEAAAGAKLLTKIFAAIAAARPGGLAGWLLDRLRRRMPGAQRPAPRLRLVERIALGPRQMLALVEAEGRRVLVAISPEGAPAFYAIDGAAGGGFGRAGSPAQARVAARASWR
ncbi:MAG TPA: flagellar biosynthetic protein FliO [Terracidiphilus sp.]|nr:flagellar biosynthetic protein FliO [Terracidiphilus sp.]